MPRFPMGVAMVGAMVGGCASVVADKDGAFAQAVTAVHEEDPLLGAAAAWMFLSKAAEEDPRYDRALRLLAHGLENVELYWAAGMVYRRIAHDRRNMEVVPEALAGLERIVKRGIYDEDSLVVSFLAAEEFTNLPTDVQAFIDFYKGLEMARRLSDYWADARFARIPDRSEWAAQADYVRAVRFVAKGKYASAIELLERVASASFTSAGLRSDVERTLARLAFDEERYRDALRHFTAVAEMAPDDPELLLEMGWTHYYMDQPRKTLGVLLALDSPVHRKYIAPERFLLEALALRSLCQFGPARHAAARLEQKYADALREMTAGVPLKQIDQLYAAARLRGATRETTLFAQSLASEREVLRSKASALGHGLTQHLDALYRRGLTEAARRERDLVDDDLLQLGEELLEAREGVHLILHELSVAMLRGQRREEGRDAKPMPAIPITGDRVYYPFVGEYWTDELDDFVVIAEDRCID